MLEHPVILAGQDLANEVQGVAGLLGLENFRVETVGRLRTSAADHHWHQSQPDDVCLILLTSGSTGRSLIKFPIALRLAFRLAGAAQLTQFDAAVVMVHCFLHADVLATDMSHLMPRYA